MGILRRNKTTDQTATQYADSVVKGALGTFTYVFDEINTMQSYLADAKAGNEEIIEGLKEENAEADRQLERNSRFLDAISPFVLTDVDV